MTEPGHRAHGAHEHAQAATTLYVHFGFYRADPAYRRLLPNEKLVAKQEFLSSIESFDHRLQFHSYSLLGLRADCDLLLWRIGADLEVLQEMAARAMTTGLGKYLLPVHSYLGTVPEGWPREEMPGRERFLFVYPVQRGADWKKLPAAERRKLLEEEAAAAARLPGMRVHFIEAFGLDGHSAVLAAESNRPQDLSELAQALASTGAARYTAEGSPTFSCIRHDLEDILDQLG